MKVISTIHCKMLLLILFLLCSYVEMQAQSPYKAVREVKDSYSFWIYDPRFALSSQRSEAYSDYDEEYFEGGANDVETKRPLIINLHGRSLCGNDMNRVLRYGTLTNVARGLQIDAYVVAPLNPGGAWNPAKLLRMLDWMIANYDVDPTRVYVIGMSLGGYGVIDFVGTYPNRIAAAMALCGGGTLKSYDGLRKVPLWIIHGTADRAVPVTASRSVVAAMKACGDVPLLRYDEWAGVNHSQPAKLFAKPIVYEWLICHSLTDNPRQVNREIQITKDILNGKW